MRGEKDGGQGRGLGQFNSPQEKIKQRKYSKHKSHLSVVGKSTQNSSLAIETAVLGASVMPVLQLKGKIRLLYINWPSTDAASTCCYKSENKLRPCTLNNALSWLDIKVYMIPRAINSNTSLVSLIQGIKFIE